MGHRPGPRQPGPQVMQTSYGLMKITSVRRLSRCAWGALIVVTVLMMFFWAVQLPLMLQDNRLWIVGFFAPYLLSWAAVVLVRRIWMGLERPRRLEELKVASRCGDSDRLSKVENRISKLECIWGKKDVGDLRAQLDATLEELRVRNAS